MTRSREHAPLGGQRGVTRAVTALALGAALSCAACDEKKTSSQARVPDANAGPDKYATADPKLANALQATTTGSGDVEKGPPPAGIFAAGVADQRHAKGAPTHVELVAEGSEPRVSLLAAPDSPAGGARARAYGPALLEVALQTGPRVAMPTTDFVLSIGPAKKDDGGADWLVADVKRAVPARHQLGDLPAGVEKDIASLVGTSIRIKMSPDGLESEVDTQPGKTTHSELERLAWSAGEALVLANVPLPPRPVGVGAQWIAETRMPLLGLDVIAYRAYRVKDIEGDRVHLTVDVKAYATSREVQFAGVPKGSTLEQFDAESGGEIELLRGESLARKSEMQERVVMVFQAPGAAQAPAAPGLPPGNMMTAQFHSQATLARGDDGRSATKQP